MIYHEDWVVRKFNERTKIEMKEKRLDELKIELKTKKSSESKLIKEYSNLGLEIDRLYKERERICIEAKERWTNIVQAKEVLTDRVKRKIYDLENFPSKHGPTFAVKPFTCAVSSDRIIFFFMWDI